MNQLEKPFDIITQKICNLLNHQLKKHIKPTINLNYVTDLDMQLVKQLKQNYGIGGIILDVDETLREDMMEIPNCNKEWVKFINQEFKVAILSNGLDKKVKKFALDNGIEYFGMCRKPGKRCFLEAVNKMGLEPENVLVVGDDIICDVYGGNRCGMITAIVEDVVGKDEFER